MTWSMQLIQAFARPFQWWVVVAAWEQAVIVRFGKHTKHVGPGVHFRIPFLDRVFRLCVRDRMVNTDNRTVSTSDGKTLTIGMSLRYSIKDAQTMLGSVARPEETLTALAQAEAAQVVASMSSHELTPAAVQDHVRLILNREEWGLNEVGVFVVTWAFARTYRLLQANDHGYGSRLDCALDEKPATVD